MSLVLEERRERPPVFDRCCAVFGRAVVDRPGVIFSWGNIIYNPSGTPIPRPLRAHEAVHGLRQLGYDTNETRDSEGDVVNDLRIEAWWERYLTDPIFRLDEELYAHHAEYLAHKKRHGHQPRMFNFIAQRLSGPLYGSLLTLEQAKHAILTGVVTLDPRKEEPLKRRAA